MQEETEIDAADYYRVSIQNILTVEWNGCHCSCNIKKQKDGTCSGRYVIKSGGAASKWEPCSFVYESSSINNALRRREWEKTLKDFYVLHRSGDDNTKTDSDMDHRINIPEVLWPVFHNYLRQSYPCFNVALELVCGMFITYECRIEPRRSARAALRRKWRQLKSRIRRRPAPDSEALSEAHLLN